ncbi:MAG: ATP-dependent metallopeptidase FtsH/Yme1/Tma family protein, partial [Proteobacteria bacterium]|nr:ATP-dependent metallopeptidase FtsH/Yme1/Tma family protein [Pseudomonadota bacterium]
MNPNFRNIALWAIILLLVLALVSVFQSPGARVVGQELNYSGFVDALDRGRVDRVVISGSDITGTFNDGSGAFQTYSPVDTRLLDKMRDRGVNITFRSPNQESPWYMSLLVNWLPLVFFLGVWIFMSRQMQNGAGRAMGFGKSKAKL